ncbi:MAG: serine/threonine protein kinase, partial [Planctomycetia bacterium]|nr:serine/threonine protein kinase [Planctomycetia bacterium]
VLARLRHPHIAQIHTFGTFTTAGGTGPFFVMEFVPDAQSITAFAASRGLGNRDRVAVFRRVCGAVAHGHRMGVVHRDLKPGNILVDRDGDPKVIDFGVARLTDGERAAATAATGAGDLVGTLRYMSPEQLGIDDAVVDARTDVYALGLVLHELLAGELPYDLRGKTPVEAACLLAARTVPPLREMCGRFRSSGASAQDAEQLAVMVGKCLAPQPASRYADAGSLEADLGRWLDGEPVMARPPTLAESLVRFARKHRAASLAACTAAAALLAAVVGISWFSLRAELRRREAVAAWRAADELTADARRQLYTASLMLSTEARDRGNVNEARRLLQKAVDLRDAAGPRRGIELDCLAASLDDAIAVIDPASGRPRVPVPVRVFVAAMAARRLGARHRLRGPHSAPARHDDVDGTHGAAWSRGHRVRRQLRPGRRHRRHRLA